MLAVSQKRKILFGAALTICIILSAGFLVTSAAVRAFEASRWVDHTLQVLDMTYLVRKCMFDSERGQRGYLITGREDYLEPFKKGTARAIPMLEKLSELTGDNPEQQKKLFKMNSLASTKLAELNETIETYRESGFEPSRKIVLSDRGKNAMEEFMLLADDFVDTEKQLLKVRRQKQETEFKDVMTFGSVLVACGLLSFGASFYAALRFLSDANRAEQRAKANEQKFLGILNTAADGMVIVDSAQKITMLNIAAEKMLGYTESELRGETLNKILQSPQGTNKSVAKILESTHSDEAPLTTDRPSDAIELTGIRKDGAQIPIEMTISSLLAQSERTYTCLLRDISNRKEVERRLSEFYSTVSHELRTPITSIRGALKLIETNNKGQLSPRLTQLVQIGRQESERLIRLINDLLDIKKIEAGKLELSSEHINAHELAEQTVEAIRAMASDNHVKLVVQIGAQGAFYGDRDRIAQVLTNLLSNAIKYSSPEGEVVLEVDKISDRIRFSISDKGPGISEENLAKLFGMFQQVDSSDERPKGGTGLGLAISKAIVERHGGTIGVKSLLGQGSTFWFEVPAMSSAFSSISEQPAGANKLPTILLIDDDDTLCAILQASLLKDGFDVRRAATLKQANEVLETFVPRAILLDMHLPDGNGLEFMEGLRHSPKTDGIPVIMITGSEPSVKKFTHPFLVDILRKPFSEDSLAKALSTAIGQKSVESARVLVVEDDPSTRRILTEHLQQLNVQCTEVDDGQKALGAIMSEQFDLVILDLGLPKLDGFDLIKILKKNGTIATPLLVYTARDLTNAEKHELTLGLSNHLTKSETSEEQLVEVVHSMLDRLIARKE